MLVLGLKLQAQNNPFKKVGNDLPFPAIDACFDNNNVLYSICASNDSLYVYYFNTVNNQWVKDAKMGFQNEVYNRITFYNAKCFFIDTTLFLNVSNGTDTTRIYRINPNKTFTKIANLYAENTASEQAWVNKIEKSNNICLITGNFNKLNSGIDAKRIVKFDGTTFTSLNTGTSYFSSIFTRNDTMFYEHGDTLLAYNLINNTRSVYYVSKTQIISIIGDQGSLYYADIKGDIFRIKQNTLIEKIKGFNFTGGNLELFSNLFYFDNKFIANLNYTIGHREFYIKDGNSLKGLRTPDYSEDYHPGNIEEVKVISDQNSNLFLISCAERVFNSTRYNIIKFRIDSLNSFGFDSIYLRTYGDKDKSGTFNIGDETHSGFGMYLINGIFPFKDFSGSNYEKTVLPDYRNYKLSVLWDFFDPGCYQMPIIGSYTTNNLVQGKTLDTLDFGMVINGINSIKDIRFVNSSRARLNDTIMNLIRVQDFACNQGNSTAYAKVILAPKTQFISAGYNFTNKKGDTLFFKIDSINSRVHKSFFFKTKYSNTDFAIDDLAVHHVILTQSAFSNQTIYSRDSIQSKMVYSYDPNIKLAQPSGSVYANANKMRYTIHFQNEGNDDARDVTVVDRLDNRFKTATFKMVEASHPYTVSIFKNTLTWEFKNINLKPKNTNEALSSGYVVFEVEKTAVLNIGDSIRNNAEIYFDLNSPIITNFATLRVVEKPQDSTVSIQTVLDKNILSIYPNPSNGNLSIELANLSTNASYEIYTLEGKLLESKSINNRVSVVSLQQAGLYIVKVIIEGKVYNYKIVVN